MDFEMTSARVVGAIVALQFVCLLIVSPRSLLLTIPDSLLLIAAVYLSPMRSIPLLLRRTHTVRVVGLIAFLILFAVFPLLKGDRFVLAVPIGVRLLWSASAAALALFATAVHYRIFRQWKYRQPTGILEHSSATSNLRRWAQRIGRPVEKILKYHPLSILVAAFHVYALADSSLGLFQHGLGGLIRLGRWMLSRPGSPESAINPLAESAEDDRFYYLNVAGSGVIAVAVCWWIEMRILRFIASSRAGQKTKEGE